MMDIVRVGGRELRIGRTVPPPELFLSHREPSREVYVYAPWGIHFVLRWWQRRWCIADLLINCGILTLQEGDYYRNARVAPLGRWFRDNGISGTIR
jgi:hypothetical protein